MINLNGVGKTFHQKGREIVALKPTNLHIKQGEIFGIVGYSGAGKSTLKHHLVVRSSSMVK